VYSPSDFNEKRGLWEEIIACKEEEGGNMGNL